MRRGLIEAQTPAEWNIKVLTQDDFDYYCDRAGITVQEASLEQPGIYICRRGRPQIYLNDELRGVKRLHVGFHELAHYWLHPPMIQFFNGWDKSLEREANIVAICCLIPVTLLTHYWPGEIVELYGYPPDMVEERREVFDRWRI